MKTILNKHALYLILCIALLFCTSCGKKKSFNLTFAIHNNTNQDIIVTYTIKNEPSSESLLLSGEKYIYYNTSKLKNERDCKKSNSLSAFNVENIQAMESCAENTYSKDTQDCKNWSIGQSGNYTTYTLKIRNKDFE